MTNSPKSMDPDRFQMKDIKRRVTVVERLATSTAQSWARWKNRIRDLEGTVADIAESLTYLQTHTFVRATSQSAVKEVSDDPYDESEEGSS